MFHCNWSQGWVHRHCTWALGAKMTFSQYIKTQIEVLRCNRRFWQFDFWGYTSIQCFPLNGTYTFLSFLGNTGRVVSSRHWHLTVLLPLTPLKCWKCVMRWTHIHHCCCISTTVLNCLYDWPEWKQRSWAKCMIQPSDPAIFMSNLLTNHSF